MNNKFFPLKVVGNSPLYADDGSGRLVGWLMSVDFPGITIPKARGGVVHESYTDVAPKGSGHGRLFETRVEYLFKDSLLGSGYTKMCKFQNKMDAQIKKRQVQDLKDKKIITLYACSWSESDDFCSCWKVFSIFKGDITSLFNQPDLVKACGLQPSGASAFEYEYYPRSDRTCVTYRFDEKLLGDVSRRRALNFEKYLQSMITTANRGTNKVAQEGVYPLSISDVPICDKNGYKVSVRYHGNWNNRVLKLGHLFEYNPIGATIVNSEYNSKNNTTAVDYVFNSFDLFKTNIKRAWNFIDKIHSQIDAAKQNENTK